MDDNFMVGNGASFWALLIGIDRYRTQPDLGGCANDVEAMRTLLAIRYNVPDAHIRILTNEDATRANILKEFRQFLIDNPDIRRGDQILFHYSGHGSQMPAGPDDYEPDGLNETIVPHDSRTPGVFDIPDKTLAPLLDDLAAVKGDQITVILDSCHSGSATRRLQDPAALGVRRVPADDRLPPADLDAELRPRTRSTSRAAGPSGWAMSELPYVLLAGCRDREESNEYEEEVENQRVRYGALTYFTLKVLRQVPKGTSYAELHERVAALVNAIYPSQTPQCEGMRDRQLFGGARVQRDPFVPVREVDGNVVTLGAGLVHGMRPGTQLDLYGPEVRTRADLPPEPLATVEVTSVGATTAQAEIMGVTTKPVPEHARGLITRQVYAGLRQTVALEAAEGDEQNQQAIEELGQAIHTAGPGGQESPYLEVVHDPTRLVDLRVRAEAGKFAIYNGNRESLVVPEDIEGQRENGSDGLRRTVAAVVRSLESIVRYRTLVSLENEGQSQLEGKVKLRLRRYVKGAQPEPLEPDVTDPGGDFTLYYDPDHEDRNLYVVDVINESDLEVYPHVFTLSPDYSISRLYPTSGQQDVVSPNSEDNPFTIGMERATSRLEIWLPDGWDASQDHLKAIVSTVPTDLQMLEQTGINVPPPSRSITRGRASASPLEELLGAVAFGAGTRHLRPERTLEAEDWTVTELPFKTVRKYETTRLDSPRGSIRLSQELTLVDKPEGFTGEATVTTLGLGTRGAAGDPGLRPPPGLERFPGIFEPVGRSGTRSIGPAGLVVALDVDNQSRRLITTDNPLRLALSTTRGGEEVADLLPVIFDGEDYLLAGYGAEGGSAVEVVSLPPPVGTHGLGEQPAKRGIGRTLRLFIYKKLGRYTTDTGLRRAELKNGEVVYADVRRDSFRPGQKIALFVHDFGSDTRWMIEKPAQFLSKEIRLYDHLLTWDYETFGTGVEDSGEQLALALKRQCGFGPNDGITVEVYAHGMGAVVSRCAIELSGGHEFVDRLVLAGPANLGSTLASTGRGILFLITTLLNFASLVPVLGAGNEMLRQLYQKGAGVADLAADSPALRKLNVLEEPSNVPYLVLAGENLPGEERKNHLNRIASKVLGSGLDTFFGEQNDMVVGLSSMRGLRGGAYPNLRVEVLPCDHFHYFAIPQGQQAIKRWATE